MEEKDIFQEKEWSLEISPKVGWFNLNLGELWRYRDLVMLFVRRDLVATYKQTILGPLWFLVQPVLTTIMFVVIFSRVAKLPTDGIPAPVFYMSGLILWNYFSTSLTKTSNTFLANASIFGKVYFPRLVVPTSTVISNLITFGIQLGLLLVMMIYYGLTGAPIRPNAYLFLLPLLLLVMAGLSLGLGVIVSSLTTKYRDLSFLVTFGVQLLMYATPVIYPLSYLTGKYKMLILLNPLAAVIETFRLALLGTGTFSWLYLGYSVIFTMISLLVGMLIFNKVEKSFMDVV